MTRLKYGGLLVLALSLTASGCGTSFPTTPTAPTPVTITEDFTGTLALSGGITYPFTATTSGAVNLTVMSLANSSGPAVVGPDGTIRIGLAMGVWNGTLCGVTVPTLYNDQAFVSTVVTGAVTGAGSLCVRVNDSNGTLTDPVTFDIQIQHP
jgi:hypothetical protein